MKLCFVIMPIGSGDAKDTHLNRYNNIICAAVEEFRINGEKVFEVKRADFISKTGSINKKVIQHIYKADAVVADLTELNPNVFYELGVRHSLRNGTILIALEGTKIPFDIHDLNVVFYKDRIGGEKEAIPAIQKLLSELLDSERIDDSPVFNILPELQDHQTYDFIETRAKITKLEAEITELREKLKVAEATALSLHDSFNIYERTVNAFIAKLNPHERAAVTQEVEKVAKSRQKNEIRTVDLPGEIEEDPSFVFILMSFGAELKSIYDIIRLTTNKLGFNVMKADEIAVSGRIVDQITSTIARAGIIIADITDNNPNVMLEIGIAMSLRKKIILLAQKNKLIPFDVASLRTLFYDPTEIGMELLKENLKEALTTIKEK